MKKVERVGADTSRQGSEKKNKQKPVPSFFFLSQSEQKKSWYFIQIKGGSFNQAVKLIRGTH